MMFVCVLCLVYLLESRSQSQDPVKEGADSCDLPEMYARPCMYLFGAFILHEGNSLKSRSSVWPLGQLQRSKSIVNVL